MCSKHLIWCGVERILRVWDAHMPTRCTSKLSHWLDVTFDNGRAVYIFGGQRNKITMCTNHWPVSTQDPPFRVLNSGLSRKHWPFKSLRSLSSCTVSAAVFAFLAGGGQTAVEGPAVWEEVLEVLGGSPEIRLGNVLLTSRYHRHCHRFVNWLSK